jgi:6-phosphogluconolactonase
MNTRRIGALAAVALVASVLMLPAAAQTRGAEYLVYFGTYTQPTASRGIYAYRFQPSSGKLTPIGLAAETESPSFLVVHPNGRFLYAANERETGDGPGKNNSVTAFALDEATGKLTLLNKVSSGGEWPCHVSIDQTGKFLFVANYGSGSVTVLPIQQDGRLGDAASFVQHKGASVDPVRQKGPHAHFISPSPDNRFVLSADLGTDQIVEYLFDSSKGTLTPNTAVPTAKLRLGSGPRHLAFHPTGKYVYVNGEMSSTVSAFAYDAASGGLTELQTLSTLPAGFSGTSSTAEVQIDRAGRHVYVSNRGHDSIAIFGVDPTKGTLTAAGHAPTNGKTPRYFTLDPSGNFLFAANQNSNTVTVFRVDAKTGGLRPSQSLTDIPEPVCIVFVPVK